MKNNNVFSSEIVNRGRQSEFDWAKAVAILAMVTVHVYEKISVIDTETVLPTGVFRNVLEFVAGPLAAPVFMFAMGVGMVYTRHHSSRDYAFRGLGLLKNGYLLNFFRAFIPLCIGSMIGAELIMSPVAGLLYIDVLEFAGFAFLTIALMSKLKFTPLQMLLTALVLQVAGHYLGMIHFEQEWVRYLLSPFLLTHKYTSFPLLLWLYYPVAGLCFGHLLQHVKNKDMFYKYLGFAGAAGTAATVLFMLIMHIDIRTMFEVAYKIYYNQTILHYLFTSSVIAVAMSLYYQLSKTVRNHAAVSADRKSVV